MPIGINGVLGMVKALNVAIPRAENDAKRKKMDWGWFSLTDEEWINQGSKHFRNHFYFKANL